jgi:hypothetical protein
MMDTTYCTPRWTFPSQQDAISRAADIVSKTQESSPGELLQLHLMNSSKKLVLQKFPAVLSFWDPSRREQLECDVKPSLPVSTSHTTE